MTQEWQEWAAPCRSLGTSDRLPGWVRKFLYGTWSDIATTFGGGAMAEALTRWCQADPTPLVLLIDEIDALVGDTLIAVLRQLRGGYDQRPESFPHSVVLCGVRDIRDYRIRSSSEQTAITGGSAFNVKARSLRLGDFTEADVRARLPSTPRRRGKSSPPRRWTPCGPGPAASPAWRPPCLLRRRTRP